jgi:hypothetical protein
MPTAEIAKFAWDDVQRFIVPEASQPLAGP